jgi:hypothetical protein
VIFAVQRARIPEGTRIVLKATVQSPASEFMVKYNQRKATNHTPRKSESFLSGSALRISRCFSFAYPNIALE